MRSRWFGVAGTIVAIVAMVGVVGPALVHSPSQAATAVAADPLDDAQATVATIETTTTVSSIPATVPTTPVTAPATTVATATPTTAAPTTAAPSTATPVTAVPTIGTKALALISYPWIKLGYTLTFHGPKAGFYGLTDCHTHNIDIYVTPSQTVVQVAYITAFEIGHAIDCAHLADGHHATWPALRGYSLTGSWFPSCSCSEDRFSSGDFSEVFARWQVGPAYAWRSDLAPAPTAAQLATLIPEFG
jgi:hypothetical protein